jgi:hypothetical protein
LPHDARGMLRAMSLPMKTTTAWKTVARDGVTVSTVLVREGGARWYETAIVTAAGVSDGVRTSKKYDAGVEHDFAVAVVRGYEKDAQSKRVAFYTAAMSAR